MKKNERTDRSQAASSTKNAIVRTASPAQEMRFPIQSMSQQQRQLSDHG